MLLEIPSDLLREIGTHVLDLSCLRATCRQLHCDMYRCISFRGYNAPNITFLYDTVSHLKTSQHDTFTFRRGNEMCTLNFFFTAGRQVFHSSRLMYCNVRIDIWYDGHIRTSGILGEVYVPHLGRLCQSCNHILTRYALRVIR